jgi:hypothetical protein
MSWLAVARMDIVSHVSTISIPGVPRGTTNSPITAFPSSPPSSSGTGSDM